ncbi:hypothetical protein GGR88_002061 [Sphingomonas jejuensis]|uniref:DUF2093 domain-containing protein n=1 Tax=Sphingomonas jejuensis TaxID=904715 RepID=A0ABX0XP91_9SPHN|nr:hypothetical protein [Sphingomonas jejuensis]
MTNAERPARLAYLPNGFRVISPGSHIVCARTGMPVPLDRLRYWSVERQEGYGSAEAAVDAMCGR